MYLTEAEHCCGVGVIQEFGYADDDYNYTKKQFKTIVTSFKSELKRKITGKGYNNYPIYELSFNQHQYKLFGAAARELGFKCSASGLNRNSGNKVYLFVFKRKK